MNISQLTRHQIICYFLVGFIFVLLIVFSYYKWSFDLLIGIINNKEKNYLVIGVILLPVSFLIGLIMDAIRNGILEDYIIEPHLLDYKEKENKKGKYSINWEFFYPNDTDEDNVKAFYDRYYTYYVFDMNMIIALIIVFGYSTFNIFYNCLCEYSCQYIFSSIVIGIITYIFWKDGIDLRVEMAKITNKLNNDKKTNENNDGKTEINN